MVLLSGDEGARGRGREFTTGKPEAEGKDVPLNTQAQTKVWRDAQLFMIVTSRVGCWGAAALTLGHFKRMYYLLKSGKQKILDYCFRRHVSILNHGRSRELRETVKESSVIQ